MKDRQGIIRGKCTSSGCQCTEYSKLQDLSSVRCDHCGHSPVKHIEVFNNGLGACVNCTNCSSYESESGSNYSNCEYCECPAQYHKNTSHSRQLAAKGIQSVPSQTVYATMNMSSTVAVSTLEDGPTGQLDIFQTPAPFRCKLPCCNNSCFKEVTGRVHDFCSKAHAIAYMQLQKQQVPSIMQSTKPPSFVPQFPEASAKPTQIPPTHGKLCSKCGQKPANPGRGWCQDCYIQSKQT